MLSAYVSTSTAPAESHSQHRTSRSRTPTVLFVDDDGNFCKCFRRRFRRHGLRFLEAHSGVEGYRLAIEMNPDVIVTDLAMPFGDGEDLLAALQQNPATWSIPTIVITGTLDEGRIAGLECFGTQWILRKPFDMQDLLVAIFDSAQGP